MGFAGNWLEIGKFGLNETIATSLLRGGQSWNRLLEFVLRRCYMACGFLKGAFEAALKVTEHEIVAHVVAHGERVDYSK
jgi:hypothetical protein